MASKMTYETWNPSKKRFINCNEFEGEAEKKLPENAY